MAEKGVSVTIDEYGVLNADWGSIPQNDTGKAIVAPHFPHKTIQRYAGTGSVAVTGSMDGVTYGAVHSLGTDGAPVDISLADAEPVTIIENPLYLKLGAATGGAASVKLIGTKT